MSKLRFSAATTLALAALASYGNLKAQENTPQLQDLQQTQQQDSQQTQQQDSKQTQQNQQRESQQGQQRNLQQGQQRDDLSTTDQTTDQQRYEARRVSPDSERQGISVRDAIIKKLQHANQAEIELATLAQQHTDNQELQQLAKMLVEDHKAMNQKLEQLTGNDQGRSNRNQSNQVGQRESSQRESGQRETREREGVVNRDSASNDRNQFGQTASQSAQVPEQMCKIMEQASTNALQMTKQMLQEYEGQDFQMAFLGQQIMAHTTLLAELRAIESSGPRDLQPVVQQAISKTEGHLEKIKQLARKLEDDTKNQTRR